MKQSYYAIIPADVRYDNNLKPNEKLMYGEITALSNQYGFCFASNEYFASLYNKTTQTISVWIHDLEKTGCIHVFIFRSGYTVVKRVISIDSKNKRLVKKNLNNLLRKKRRTSYEKSKQVIKKNLKYKNTRDKSTRLMNVRDDAYKQSQVDSILNNFQHLFAEASNIKFEQYVNQWIAKKISPARIISVMKYARKNCRTMNPSAIASYINGCLKYPMRPKHKSSNNHVYRNKGRLKRTAQIVAQHRGDVFTPYNKDDLAVAKVLIDRNMDQHSDKAIAKARKIARGDNK